jgi:hypothetical protein
MIYALSASFVSENGLETLALVSRRRVCAMQNLLIWLFLHRQDPRVAVLSEYARVGVHYEAPWNTEENGHPGFGEHAITVPSFAK